MDIVCVVGVCIIAAILCKVMDKYQKEYALFISLAVSIAVVLICLIWISPLVEEVKSIFALAGTDSGYIEILLKSLGICYITQLACDVCKDCGENAICTQIELAGKVSLLLIALPLFRSLISIVTNLL